MASTLQTAPAPPIDALDFLRLGDGLSDEERLIRDNVRAFVREQLIPNVAEWFEQGKLPRELAGQLGALGVLGMHLDGYGCAGASATAYGIVCQELEAGDSGLRSFVSVQGSLAMFAIWRFGSEEQKQEWLPRMAAGEAIGCFGLTEPDAGSDPGSMRTTAKRSGDGLGAQRHQDVDHERLAVRRRGRLGAHRRRRARLPRPARHARLHDAGHPPEAVAARLGDSELILDDVRLPASAQLPEAEGLRAPLACLNEARFGIVFGAIGAARACYEAALEYAGSRVQFGKPIAAFQLTQAKLAQMLLKVNQGALLALHLGRMKDAGRLRPEHVSFGKLANVNAALEVCREARQVLGANGITLEYPVIRHMNNLESVVTYEGTAEVHALVLGQAITGHSAYR